jgi:hypothetical protein
MNLAATIRKGVHASAVGHGVAHAIYAAAAPMSAEEWVIFCCTAADEAEATVRESPSPREMGSAERLLRNLSPGEEFPELDRHNTRAEAEGIREAGAAAFRACMPKLTGRRMTQAYIACVAAGVQRHYFNGSEAKALLYTAQLALSAHPHRRVNRGRKDSK